MMNKIKFFFLRKRLKHHKVCGLIDRYESFFLYQVAINSTMGEIVEIGSHYGYSTICLASSGKRVYAIDPHYGNLEHRTDDKTFNNYFKFRDNLEKFNLWEKVTAMVLPSYEAVTLWNRPIGVLWIDGNHSYEHVAQDHALWSPYLLKGGVLAFHDAAPDKGWPGPQQLIREIGESGLFNPFQYVNGIAWTTKL